LRFSKRFVESEPVKLQTAILGIFGFCCLLCAQGTAPGTEPPDGFDLKRIDSYLAAQVKERGRVGLSVAIVKDGKLVLAKGYGERSLADRRPVEPTTIFPIGSVTKQFTCACVLLLAQDGKLSVHDKVAQYFPELARAADISLLDLMNHTSGYPDYYPLDFVDSRMQKPITPAALLQEYAGRKLDFEPATEWSYSNTGFILLGRVVEKVSGQPFGEFLTERILKPLEMTNSIYEPKVGDKRLAVGYTSFALSPPEPVAAEARGWLGAAGALCSTPSDLVKWDIALIEGRLLQPDTYKVMVTPRELSNGQVTGYGCGIGIREQERRVVLRHTGAVSGFNAYNAVVPSTKSALVVLCNKDGGLGSIPDTLLGLLLKDESNVPKVAGPPVADTVKKIFAQLQAGNLDRGKLGTEFNLYLAETKLASAAKRLNHLDAPRKVEVVAKRERGGLEVSTTRLTFSNRTLEVLMYRSLDGTIEQFFVDEP
jgi:CubicO group peptidase (beta-lactamase class C family)